MMPMAPPPTIQVLAVVAVTADQPDGRLRRGQVGTVVDRLAPGLVQVEFCDQEGRTWALEAIRDEDLLPLTFEPSLAA